MSNCEHGYAEDECHRRCEPPRVKRRLQEALATAQKRIEELEAEAVIDRDQIAQRDEALGRFHQRIGELEAALSGLLGRITHEPTMSGHLRSMRLRPDHDATHDTSDAIRFALLVLAGADARSATQTRLAELEALIAQHPEQLRRVAEAVRDAAARAGFPEQIDLERIIAKVTKP